MAVLSLRVWWVAVAILLWTQTTHGRELTLYDIREAMMALVRTLQSSESKLERHEYREKTLGDHLKKTLTSLEKKHRTLEPLNGMITRLDERLSNVETILLQKEDREKKSLKELEGIQRSLQTLTSTVTQALKPAKKTDTSDNLTTTVDTMDRRLTTTDVKIDAIKVEIENIKKSLTEDILRATCLDLAGDMNPLVQHFSNAEKLLNKYEMKLNDYNVTVTKAQNDSASLDDVSLADEAWHSNMTEVMVRQEKDIMKIHKLLSDAENMWKDLPRRADLHLATNQTLDAIVNATESNKDNNEKSVGTVTTKLREMSDRLVATNEDIQKSLTQGNTMSERTFGNISKTYESLRTEKEDREKKSLKELEGIQRSLQTLTSTVTQALKPAKKTDTSDNLTTTEDTMDRRLNTTDAKIDAVKVEIENIKKSLTEDILRATCLDLAGDMNPLVQHFSNAEKLLNKYEMKLNDYNVTVTKAQNDSASLDDVSLADEAWHSNMTEVMVRQEKDIMKIHKLLSDAENIWKDLPRRADLHLATNQALDAIVNATESNKDNNEKSVGTVTTKLREMSDRLVATNEDIQKSLTQGNTMSERTFGNISKTYESLRTELQTLTSSKNVLLDTADNVIATKKSVEFSVHQILTGVGDLLKAQSMNMNTTINDRFDSIELSIANNQTASLANLTASIELAMSQVWMEVSNVRQRLTTNKAVLDSLSKQTLLYISSSTKSMKKVKDDVDKISVKVKDLGINMHRDLDDLKTATKDFNDLALELSLALMNFNQSGNGAIPTGSDPDASGPHVIPSAE